MTEYHAKLGANYTLQELVEVYEANCLVGKRGEYHEDKEAGLRAVLQALGVEVYE